MGGTYVFRAEEAHRCYPPAMGEAPGPRLGDIWRCDDCGRHWELKNRWWSDYKWVRCYSAPGL